MRNTSPWTHLKQTFGQDLQRVWEKPGPARAQVQDSWRSLALPYKLVFVAVAIVLLIIFPTQAFPWDPLSTTPSSKAIWYVGAIGIVFALIVLPFLLWWLPKRKAASLTSDLREQFDIANEARKTWAPIAGGMVILIGLLFTWANFPVTWENLRVTQETATNSQITERSTKAIAQLGDKNITVRIGGIYALEQVAKISKDEHWPIMEILTAYLRKNCPRLLREAPLEAAEAPRPRRYAADIEAVLTVLKRRTLGHEKKGECTSLWPVESNQANSKEEGECLNLRSTNLNYANLQNFDLQRAHFASAHLRKTYFSDANLQKANFYGAKLEGATLYRAQLQEAILWRADLRGANLSGATLTNADLREAFLQNADLTRANFSGAKLEGANLQGAVLKGALKLDPEQLVKVETLYEADLDPLLEEKIKQEDPQKHSQLRKPPAAAPGSARENGEPTIDSIEYDKEDKEKITVTVKIDRWPLKDPPKAKEHRWYEQIIVRLFAIGNKEPPKVKEHLWLAVKHGNLIWPKDPEVPVHRPNPESKVTVYEEGTPPGGKFTLALYLVQDKGHEQIRDWLSLGNATGTFPGLRTISESRLLDDEDLPITSTDSKPLTSAGSRPRPDLFDRCAK